MNNPMQMKQQENEHPQQMSWPDAVRDLIQHENNLINDRIGWMATLEGFLFAALSFSWQHPSRGWRSPILVLSLTGIIVAGLSIWAIWLADNRIHEMLKKLRDHSYQFAIDPPVWGPVSYEIRSRGVKDRMLIPWIWLPVVIAIAWILVFGEHLSRSDLRLRGEWPGVVHGYMRAVFEHNEEADRALARLAGMPGDRAKGETVFKERGCTGCHRPKDGALSVEALQRNQRIDIVRGILSPTEMQPAHGKSMPKGILSTMSPEEFLDVVEYLSSPPP